MDSSVHRTLKWGLLSLFLLVPLAVFYRSFYPSQIKDLLLVGVTALASLGWLWVSIVEERIALRLSWTRVVLTYNLAVWVISLVTSAHPSEGLFPLSVRLAGLGFLLLLPVFVTRPLDLKQAVGLLLAAQAVMGLYGIVQALGIDPFLTTEGMEGHFRVRATAIHPNFFASFLAGTLCLNVAAFRLFGAGARNRALLAATFVLGLGAEVATLSRAGWGGALLGLLLVCAVLLWDRRRAPAAAEGGEDQAAERPRQNLALYVMPVVLVLGVVLALLLSRMVLDPGEGARVRSLGGDTLTKRVLIYRAGLKMAADAPLLGHGLGTFALNLPPYRSAELTRFFPRNEYHVEHAVSEPLEVLVESGALGLIGWLALVAFFVLRPLWAMGRVKEPGLRALLAGCSAGFLGIAAHSCLEVQLRFQPVQFMFWALPALAFAAEKVGLADGAPPPLRRINVTSWPARLGLSAAVGMTMGLAFAYMLSDFVANVHVAGGGRALARGQLSEAEASFRSAQKVWAGNLPARYRRAYTLWKLGHLKQAEAQYREVVRRSPYYFDVNHNLARVLFDEKRYAEAERFATIAVKLNPYHVPSHELAVRLALRRGDMDRAEALARGILKRAEHHVGAHLALARVHLARHNRPAARRLLQEAARRFPESKEVRALLGTVTP